MSKPQEENRALEHLNNQGFEVFFPLIKHYSLKKGRQQAVVEPMFQRYLFVKIDNDIKNWGAIRSTRGVSRMVKFANQPALVPDTVIEQLKSSMPENVFDQTKAKPFLFKSGDQVEITEGSFKGWQAIVKEQDRDLRVILLLQMLGKVQSLRMPIQTLRKLGAT